MAIIAFANQLVSKVTPQTVANYLSHLAAVFAIARRYLRKCPLRSNRTARDLRKNDQDKDKNAIACFVLGDIRGPADE